MAEVLGWWRRFNAWRAAVTARKHLHAAAWGSAMVPTEGSISPFQRSAQQELDAMLASRGLPVVWNIASYDKDRAHALEGVVPGMALRLWLYDDTLSYRLADRGNYYEHWDYDSPAAMINAFLAEVAGALDRASKSVGPLYARTGVQILNSRRTGAMGHTWIAELLSSAAVEQQRPQPPGPQRLRTIASLPQ